jgi:hypothetical protein
MPQSYEEWKARRAAQEAQGARPAQVRKPEAPAQADPRGRWASARTERGGAVSREARAELLREREQLYADTSESPPGAEPLQEAERAERVRLAPRLDRARIEAWLAAGGSEEDYPSVEVA